MFAYRQGDNCRARSWGSTLLWVVTILLRHSCKTNNCSSKDQNIAVVKKKAIQFIFSFLNLTGRTVSLRWQWTLKSLMLSGSGWTGMARPSSAPLSSDGPFPLLLISPHNAVMGNSIHGCGVGIPWEVRECLWRGLPPPHPLVRAAEVADSGWPGCVY